MDFSAKADSYATVVRAHYLNSLKRKSEGCQAKSKSLQADRRGRSLFDRHAYGEQVAALQISFQWLGEVAVIADLPRRRSGSTAESQSGYCFGPLRALIYRYSPSLAIA